MRYARDVWGPMVIAAWLAACAHGERTGLDDELLGSADTSQNSVSQDAAKDGASSILVDAWSDVDGALLQADGAALDASTEADAALSGDSSLVEPDASIVTLDAGRPDAAVVKVDSGTPKLDAGAPDAGNVNLCVNPFSCATSASGGTYIITGDVSGQRVDLQGGFPTFFQLTISESSSELIDLGARLRLTSPVGAAYELRVYAYDVNEAPSCSMLTLRGTNVLTSRVDTKNRITYAVVVEIASISGQCGQAQWSLRIDSEPRRQ